MIVKQPIYILIGEREKSSARKIPLLHISSFVCRARRRKAPHTHTHERERERGEQQRKDRRVFRRTHKTHKIQSEEREKKY